MLNRNLKVMDLTAISICRDNGLTVRVINIREPGTLLGLLAGETVGSIVTARRDSHD